MTLTDHAVEEMQGLYGPYTMHEKIVQKMWLQADFDIARARLVDGRPLEIVSQGKWNLLGGPDFFGARIRIDGREITGDVEIHFRASDWAAHGHAANPSYADVILHVVLFPPNFPECAARRYDGTLLPTLVLLPLLHRDLEEYAADAALETLTARDDWRRFAELANQPIEVATESLRMLALARWERRVTFMRMRIERLGWADAAHHTALEIFGYRRNRSAMVGVATRWPLDAWASPQIASTIYRSHDVQWNRHGVRPANQPRARLLQYESWVRAVPNWPARLEEWGSRLNLLPEQMLDTATYRQGVGLKEIAATLVTGVTAQTVGGSRFHTLVCDGFLPLLAAKTGVDLSQAWFNWFPGDVPESVGRALQRLGIAGVPGKPQCHGFGQGLLAWLIEQDFQPAGHSRV